MKTSLTAFAELQPHHHGSTSGCGIQALEPLRSCRGIDTGLHTDTTTEVFKKPISPPLLPVPTLRIRLRIRPGAVGFQVVPEVPQVAAAVAGELQQRAYQHQVEADRLILQPPDLGKERSHKRQEKRRRAFPSSLTSSGSASHRQSVPAPSRSCPAPERTESRELRLWDGPIAK